VTGGDPIPAALDRHYKFLRLEWTQELRMLRLRMNVHPVPCYTFSAMSELRKAFNDIDANPGLVRHYVMTSDVPNVYNFGGDLELFALLVKARDLDSLKLYGRKCIDLIWWVEKAAERSIRTTVLAQGDALGGGLESVLPFQNIVFERSVRAGFPEALFNLFPGMGAWNFTIRRAGFQVANEMILSGSLYSADELLRRGMVDHVVDDGDGERKLENIVRSIDGRHHGQLAALRARTMAAPVTYESLAAIVDHWAETAMGLTDRDLRLMERLARAQVRKLGGAETGAAEEIKRIELETAWGEFQESTQTAAWES